MGARRLNEQRIIVQRNQRYLGFLQLSDHRPSANANGQQQFDSRLLSAFRSNKGLSRLAAIASAHLIDPIVFTKQP
jgi:hypothetical protein